MKRAWISVILAVALAAVAFAALPPQRALAGATFYSQGSLAPDRLTSWNSNRGGGGALPANFTSGDIFVIQNVHNMATTTPWSISGTGSKLWIETGGTLTANHAVTLASATTFQIDAGGTYIHNNTTAYGGSIFQGTEAFDAASTVILNNSSTTGPSGVTFGNLTIDFTSDPTGSVNCSGGLSAINGDLTVQNTGTREVRLSTNSGYALKIAGDLLISGGMLNLTNGTLTGVNYTLNIGGNYRQSGGTFTSGNSNSPATVVFTGGTSPVTFSTSGGTFTNTNLNWQIASGKTVALNTNFGAGGWVAAGRTMTVNGALQLNQGADPGSTGTWTYGTGATLIFNNTTGAYSVNTVAWWPATSGPTNVTAQGSGGLTMNTARTVAGDFTTAAPVTNGGNLTLNGAVRIAAGGGFATPPNYGSASLLVYRSGDVYDRGAEWGAGTSQPGYPANVQISNNTVLNYPNGSTAARSLSGNLTIDAGSELHMDYGSPGLNQPLTVGGDVTLNGSLSLGDAPGGDLHIRGHWIHNGGAFNTNSRTVAFDGSTGQTIGGAASTAFDALTIANSSPDSAGVTLGSSQTVNGTLTLTDGLVKVGPYSLTLGPGAALSGGSVDSMVVTDMDGSAAGDGYLCKRYSGNGSFTFPVGDAFGTTEYSPATLNFTSGTFSSAQVCVDVTNAKHPTMPGSNYITRYWTVMQSGISGFTCDTTFNYVTADISGTEANLSGAHWDTVWTVFSAVDTGNHQFTAANVSGFSQFSAGAPGPLAVDLAAFTAESGAEGVTLTWETVSEQDTAGFNLYRAEGDLTGFAETCQVCAWIKLNAALIPAAAPGSSAGHRYTWSDATARSYTSYIYRLEAVDWEGTATVLGTLHARAALRRVWLPVIAR